MVATFWTVPSFGWSVFYIEDDWGIEDGHWTMYNVHPCMYFWCFGKMYDPSLVLPGKTLPCQRWLMMAPIVHIIQPFLVQRKQLSDQSFKPQNFVAEKLRRQAHATTCIWRQPVLVSFPWHCWWSAIMQRGLREQSVCISSFSPTRHTWHDLTGQLPRTYLNKAGQ